MNAQPYKVTLITFKVIFALFGLGAVGNEIRSLLHRGQFMPSNFFSFFTIQSNLFASIMFIIGAYVVLRGIQSAKVDALRGAATLYMCLTGLVFAILLAGLDPKVLTSEPIDNQILHYLIPIVAAVDWLLDMPSARVKARTVLLWLVYPLIYLFYTLVRGPIVHWYPYPFINPTTHGYGPVVGTCLIITLGVIIGGFVIRSWSLLVHRQSS